MPRVPSVSGYWVQRCIGVGSSASVWLLQAHDGATDVALKCWHGGRITLLEEDELAREVRIASAYSHPHLLRVHALAPVRWERPAEAMRIGDGISPGPGATPPVPTARVGLLLDYAAGGSLGHLVRARGPLSIGEVITVLTPLAQVLDYLHSEGVVHGDVSPGNVLLDAHGRPLLADFGLSSLAAERAKVRGGTAGFTAPELERGNGGLDRTISPDSPPSSVAPSRRVGGAALPPTAMAAAADIYGLAAVGWYALTGVPPGETRLRAPLSVHCPGVPTALVNILEAGLDEDPRARPNAGVLATALYRCAPAEPVDLVGAVHPSVIPELLTRRPAAKPRGWRSVPGAVRRRARRKPPSPQERTSRRKLRTQSPEPRRATKSAHRHVLNSTDGARRSQPKLVRLIRWLAAGTVLALTASACFLLLTKAAEPNRTAQPAPATTSAQKPLATMALPDHTRVQLMAADPVEALSGLAWLRSYALSSGQLELLKQVNVPDSPAAAADSSLGDSLQKTGHILVGLDTSISDSKVVNNAHDVASVEATVAYSGFVEQDASGAVVATQPAASPLRLTFALRLQEGRWMISSIAGA